MRCWLGMGGLALLIATLGCGRVVLADGYAQPGAGGEGGWTGSSSKGTGAGSTNSGLAGAGGGWTSGSGGGWTSSSSWTNSSSTGAGGGWSTTSWTSGSGGGWSTTSWSTGPSCAPLGDPCTGCMASACPETYCDCAGEVECFDVIQCSNHCDDDACRSACLSQHPNGISKAVLLGDCAATVCKPSCPMSEGELTPCELCLYSDCASAMNSCLSAPACLELWTCLSSCPYLDLACQQGCYAQHGDGVAPLQALFECSDQSCSGACQ